MTSFFEYAELNRYDGVSWSPQPYRFREYVTDVEGDGADVRRVSFQPPNAESWWWLRAENEFVEYGFLFPPAARERGSVEFAIESTALNGALTARALLSPRSTELVAKVDAAWRAYTGPDRGNAAQHVASVADVRLEDVGVAVEVLYDKWESPLAATIASMILLRVDAGDTVRGWQRNLALRVNYSADAAIFYLQDLLRGDEPDRDSVRRAVDAIRNLGLPFTSEAFGYIANLGPALQQHVPEVYEPATFERINEFNAFSQPGSLFSAVRATASTRAKGHLRDRLLGLGMMEPA